MLTVIIGVRNGKCSKLDDCKLDGVRQGHNCDGIDLLCLYGITAKSTSYRTIGVRYLLFIYEL